MRAIRTTVFQLLREFWSSKQQFQAATDEIKLLHAEHERIQIGQDQFRKNFSALVGSGREVSSRDQILDGLESSENRRCEINTRIRELQNQPIIDGSTHPKTRGDWHTASSNVWLSSLLVSVYRSS